MVVSAGEGGLSAYISQPVTPPQRCVTITDEGKSATILWTKLHWIDGPWPGKLAIAARPRGGEWLDDEIGSWRREGIGTVFSLLTPEEERDLDVAAEASTARIHGMKFWSFPILDRQVPDSESRLSQALRKLDTELEAGRNVVLHCRRESVVPVLWPPACL